MTANLKKYFRFLPLFLIIGCASKSGTLPNYSVTRLKVNTGAAQSASEDAKRSALEIKQSEKELKQLDQLVEIVNQKVKASRINLAR
jgi:hypothetical protein